MDSDAPFSSSIDLYRTLIQNGMTVQACIPENCYWKDIGTPRQYQSAVLDLLLPQAFQQAFPDAPAGPTTTTPIAGDGSDRRWHRVSSPRHSLIVADHGIHSQPGHSRRMRGLCRHWQASIRQGDFGSPDLSGGCICRAGPCRRPRDPSISSLLCAIPGITQEILAWYEKAVRLLIDLSVDGGSGFDPSWTYQTPVYDKALILEKECRYFVEAFLNRYLNLDIHAQDLMDEFDKPG